MPADLGGNGFEPLAQEVDLDDEPTREWASRSLSMSLLDDGPQFGAAVEGGLGNPGVSRDGGEGDGPRRPPTSWAQADSTRLTRSCAHADLHPR